MSCLAFLPVIGALLGDCPPLIDREPGLMRTLDKREHFQIGQAMSDLMLSAGFPRIHACAVVTLAAGGKEAYDSMGHGTAEFGDFLATVKGCLPE